MRYLLTRQVKSRNPFNRFLSNLDYSRVEIAVAAVIMNNSGDWSYHIWLITSDRGRKNQLPGPSPLLSVHAVLPHTALRSVVHLQLLPTPPAWAQVPQE
jgi:hypothetical protein